MLLLLVLSTSEPVLPTLGLVLLSVQATGRNSSRSRKCRLGRAGEGFPKGVMPCLEDVVDPGRIEFSDGREVLLDPGLGPLRRFLFLVA